MRYRGTAHGILQGMAALKVLRWVMALVRLSSERDDVSRSLFEERGAG